MARKLGLAPQRTANEARLAKLRSAGSGGMTPPRTSLDGILQVLHGSQRASLEQQMVNQQMLAAAGALRGVRRAALCAGKGGLFVLAAGGAWSLLECPWGQT